MAEGTGSDFEDTQSSRAGAGTGYSPAQHAIVIPKFDLPAEIGKCRKAHKYGLSDAAVIYAARILEVLVVAAMHAKSPRGVGDEQVFRYLKKLESRGRISPVRRSCYHTLRLLGNDVRHRPQKVSRHAMDVVLAVVWACVEWYRNMVVPLYPWPEVSQESFSTSLAFRTAVRFLDLLESGTEEADRELSRLWRKERSRTLDLSPILAGLYAERLIRLGEQADLAAAREVIDSAREVFADDVRLMEMDGWLLRAEKRPELSHQMFKTTLELMGEDSADSEIRGFLGGHCKRKWLEFRKSSDAAKRAEAEESLWESLAHYEKPWLKSGQTDAYTGINFAALSLVVGHAEVSKRAAERIARQFAGRSRLPDGSILYADYWDAATHAEAELLCGRIDYARSLYAAAFSHPDYKKEKTSIRSTKEQLEFELPCLRITCSVKAFLRSGSGRNRSMTPFPGDGD